MDEHVNAINPYLWGESLRNGSFAFFVLDNPTPMQDRSMWKQALESSWVRKECEEISPDLKLTRKLHSDPIDLLVSMEDPMNRKGTITMLIELAARLGDEAAGITQGYSTNQGTIYLEHGINFGRFRAVLSKHSWKDLQRKKERAESVY